MLVAFSFLKRMAKFGRAGHFSAATTAAAPSVAVWRGHCCPRGKRGSIHWRTSRAGVPAPHHPGEKNLWCPRFEKREAWGSQAGQSSPLGGSGTSERRKVSPASLRSAVGMTTRGLGGQECLPHTAGRRDDNEGAWRTGAFAPHGQAVGITTDGGLADKRVRPTCPYSRAGVPAPHSCPGGAHIPQPCVLFRCLPSPLRTGFVRMVLRRFLKALLRSHDMVKTSSPSFPWDLPAVRLPELWVTKVYQLQCNQLNTSGAPSIN